MLALFTGLHFLVDGLCAASMAAYAVGQPFLEPIVYYFGLYNGIAFGTQWLAGYLFDRKETWIRGAFLFVPIALGLGTVAGLGIGARTVLLGIGNSVFHASAGSLVLRRYQTYKEPGIFVSSGAVGLALGLNCIVGPYPFLVACVVLSLIAAYRIRNMNLPEAERPASETAAPAAGTFSAAAGFSLVLLLGCVILRGFGSGSAGSPYLMLFPCVFAAGKALGGILCDKAGYKKAILAIFLLSFAALQLKGLFASVLLVLAFNMTMPLTLRLVHWSFPRYPGMMFGLAAGCLLPGVYYHGFSVPLQAMAVLQFLCLAAAGYLLWKKTGRPDFGETGL